MFKSREKIEPTLWDCWRDVHSWKDFKEFLPLLEPRWMVRTTRVVRHPIHAWRSRQWRKWVESVQVGDVVCTCALTHVTVTEKKDWDQVLCSDGASYSLMNCCEPVKEDNSCHNHNVTETFTSTERVAVSPEHWGSE